MKTITFEGKQYEVEDWVRYVARDDGGDIDGDICGYEFRPILKDGYWETPVGRFMLVVENLTPWQDSLMEITP